MHFFIQINFTSSQLWFNQKRTKIHLSTMFPNQQYNESRSIWDPRDTMQISSDMRSSSVPNSQLMLHYPPNNRETQQYRHPWTVEVPQKKEIKSPDQ